MEVAWSDLAIDSLTEVIAYIENKFGKRVALSIRQLIETSVNKQSLYPNGGIPYTFAYKGKQISVRYIIVKRSKIFYTIYRAKLVVILVWDTRRDPEFLRMLLSNTNVGLL
jgi:plasmid stabilization system protein ParE